MKKLAKVGLFSLYSSVLTFLTMSMARAQSISFITLPSDLIGAIKLIINMILALVGFIAVLFLIIGGFQYITASGNPDQLESAKKTIMYSIIGIVIVVISWAIVIFVTSQLGQTVSK